MGRLKSSPTLLSAVLNFLLWSYGIFLFYGWDTAKAPSEGHSFKLQYPSNCLIRRRSLHRLFIPGWFPKGQATASAMPLFGPWPDSSLWLTRVVLFVVLSLVAGSAVWRRSGHHHCPSGVGVVFVIKSLS